MASSMTVEANPEEAEDAPSAPSIDYRPYGWMLLGAFAFAVMGALAHLAGEHVDWRIVATSRAILTLTFASLLAHRAGTKLVIVGSRTMWMRSLAGSISLLATFYALIHLPIAECLTLTNMVPLWVALLSRPMLGHAPSGSTWIAALLAVVGVAVMGVSEFQITDKPLNPTFLVALLASFTSAVAMIGLHRLKEMASTAIVAHFSGVSIFFCLAALFLPGVPPLEKSVITPSIALCLLGVGLCATTGQLSITKAFATGAPSKVSVVALTQVVFALVFDQFLWQHPIDAWKIAGMILILAPTAWVMTHRPKR